MQTKADDFSDSGFFLNPDDDTNEEFPTRCTNCRRPIQRLSVFPKNECIECHATNAPTPTAQSVTDMWRS